MYVLSEVDKNLGKKVRERRLELGLTLKGLAKLTDIGLGQIHKFEIGERGISPTNLWKLSEVLDVPVGYFFDGLESGAMPEEVAVRRLHAEFLEAVHKSPEYRCLTEALKVAFELAENDDPDTARAAKLIIEDARLQLCIAMSTICELAQHRADALKAEP